MLTISDEYSTGMIRVTLIATPRRPGVLAAKAAILTALVLAAGTIAVSGSLLTGRLIFPANRFTAAHGYPLLSTSHSPTLRAAVGSVLYLGLVGLFSLGIATAVREPAAAIGTVLASTDSGSCRRPASEYSPHGPPPRIEVAADQPGSEGDGRGAPCRVVGWISSTV